MVSSNIAGICTDPPYLYTWSPLLSEWLHRGEGDRFEYRTLPPKYDGCLGDVIFVVMSLRSTGLAFDQGVETSDGRRNESLTTSRRSSRVSLSTVNDGICPL